MAVLGYLLWCVACEALGGGYVVIGVAVVGLAGYVFVNWRGGGERAPGHIIVERLANCELFGTEGFLVYFSETGRLWRNLLFAHDR